MLIKTESKVSLAKNFMVYDKSDTSDENYEEEGELDKFLAALTVSIRDWLCLLLLSLLILSFLSEDLLT